MNAHLDTAAVKQLRRGWRRGRVMALTCQQCGGQFKTPLQRRMHLRTCQDLSPSTLTPNTQTHCPDTENGTAATPATTATLSTARSAVAPSNSNITTSAKATTHSNTTDSPVEETNTNLADTVDMDDIDDDDGDDNHQYQNGTPHDTSPHDELHSNCVNSTNDDGELSVLDMLERAMDTVDPSHTAHAAMDTVDPSHTAHTAMDTVDPSHAPSQTSSSSANTTNHHPENGTTQHPPNHLISQHHPKGVGAELVENQADEALANKNPLSETPPGDVAPGEHRTGTKIELEVGAVVVAHGLKGAAHLNDCRGVVVKGLDADSGRVGVCFDGRKDAVLIKAANLSAQASPSPSRVIPAHPNPTSTSSATPTPPPTPIPSTSTGSNTKTPTSTSGSEAQQHSSKPANLTEKARKPASDAASSRAAAKPSASDIAKASRALDSALQHMEGLATMVATQQEDALKAVKRVMKVVKEAARVVTHEHPLVDFLLGLGYKFLGKDHKALPYIRSALQNPKLDPRHRAVATDLHLLLSDQEAPTDALEAARRAVEQDSTHPGRIFAYASQLEKSGRPDLAVDHYLKALKLRPTEVNFVRSAEACLQSLGQIERCRELAGTVATTPGISYWTNKWQRAPHHVPNLRAKAWWDPSEFAFCRELEDNFDAIRSELINLIDGKWNEVGNRAMHDGDLVGSGKWTEAVIAGGSSQASRVREKCPVTSRVLMKADEVRMAAELGVGESLFSCLDPGTHLKTHCGPTNARLTCHFGLVVPPGLRIRAADDIRGWEEGKCFVFDDSFEHEVWHKGTEKRYVIMINFMHPDVPRSEWEEVAKGKIKQ